MLPIHIRKKYLVVIIPSIFFIITVIIFGYLLYSSNRRSQELSGKLTSLEATHTDTATAFLNAEKALRDLQNQDQYLINKRLTVENDEIHTTFQSAGKTYEKLLDYKAYGKKSDEMDKLFASSLFLLSERNFSSASASLSLLDKTLEDEKTKYFASLIPTTPPIPASNAPPDSGYRMQSVTSDAGTFSVGIVTGDLGSTRVIVDTASDADCGNDCPVLSLADYAGRNGAYAGVNGTYFCPAAYPSCAGKTNSFDLLVLNKNKKYFNSDNNVYSTNPGVAFLNGSVRFLGQTLEWGRDTGVDGYLSNFPLLVNGGNIVYGGDGDPKHNNKGGRSFVAAKDNKVYIGVVFNATVMESAKTLKALGMSGALNLDDGGSTALWFAGYKAGPGRNIPNAILFVQK